MITKEMFYQYLELVLNPEDILLDELLSNHTSIKLGGPCDFLVTPKDALQIKAIIDLAKKYQISITILGMGSNLIVLDKGIKGIVISLKNLNKIIVHDELMIVQAGAALIDVSNAAYQYSLTGLEFASGIPGSIGGAVYMNAGAYGEEIKDVLESIVILDSDGNFIKKTAQKLDFDYRYSNLQHTDEIVVEASFRLKQGIQEEIKSRMDALSIERSSKQPLDYPSCGSVFKRPNGFFAGKLISDCGLQGYKIGGAEVSRKHAGFIINTGETTAEDYLSLIKYIQDKVKEKFDVLLELEVKVIGEI